MKTSIQFLPEEKQEDLAIITEAILEMVKPEMVILFGSYARGNWVEDRYKENGTTYTYQSDYDILVVTKHPKEVPVVLSKKIRYRFRKAGWLSTPITIIFHDIKYLNEEIEDGSYFFVEILKDGIMLYDSGKFKLSQPKILSPARRAEKAKIYFKKWYKSAGEFLIDYGNAFSRGSYDKAIFELHQAAERYFMTIALVFTDYKPKTHDLADLFQKACNLDARFKAAFPGQTEEEKRRFKVLVKAYIDSRYKLDYSVNLDDLLWLAERVEKLKELTETVCIEKIKALEAIA